MNSAELIARVRRKVFFTAAGHPDFTDAVIIDELNDTMTTLFERAIVEARSGYWLQTIDIPVVAGTASYRWPPRACGIEKVELGVGSAPQFTPLHEVSEAHASLYERPIAQLAQPAAFVSRADRIVLLPTPDNTSYTIRVYYYLRPSRLVLAQSQGIGGVGGTVRGLITNVVGQALTVNLIPFDQEAASPGPIASSTLYPVDVVHSDGWHELTVVQATQFLSGTTITLFTGVSTAGIIPNYDYVRMAQQTDWPQLPDDFHVCLADATAVKIMTDLNMSAKASLLASAVSADLTRFQALIAPRIKSEPKTIRAPLPYLRGNRFVPGRYP